MPDLVEQMYCAEQIHIPATFPYILKQYAKAAIRTQPYDLLRWSAAYFRAMANGDEPPVKLRLEYPPIELPSGLTPGFLKVLLKQFQNQDVINEDLLYDRWKGLCLDQNALTEMLNIGNFDEDFEFLKFIAVAAGHLTNSLSQTMVMLCELLTEEPEGGSAIIPSDTFCDLYSFLARLNCGPPETEEKVEEISGITEDIVEPIVQDRVYSEMEHSETAKDIIEPIVQDIVHHSRMEPGASIVDEIVDHSSTYTDPAATIVEEIVNRASTEPATTIVNEIVHRCTLPPEPLASIVQDMVSLASSESEEDTGDESTPQPSTDQDDQDVVRHEDVKRSPPYGKEIATSIVQDIVEESTASKTKPASEILEEIIEAIPIQEDPEILERIARKEQRKLRYTVEVPGIGPVVEEDQIESVLSYMKFWAERQEGMVMPRNIRHFLCPRLDPTITVQALEEAEK